MAVRRRSHRRSKSSRSSRRSSRASRRVPRRARRVSKKKRRSKKRLKGGAPWGEAQENCVAKLREYAKQVKGGTLVPRIRLFVASISPAPSSAGARMLRRTGIAPLPPAIQSCVKNLDAWAAPDSMVVFPWWEGGS